jgi:hypothetical protein
MSQPLVFRSHYIPVHGGMIIVMMMFVFGRQLFGALKPTPHSIMQYVSYDSILRLNVLNVKLSVQYNRYLSPHFPGLHIWMSYGTNYCTCQANAVTLLLALLSLHLGHTLLKSSPFSSMFISDRYDPSFKTLKVQEHL